MISGHASRTEQTDTPAQGRRGSAVRMEMNEATEGSQKFTGDGDPEIEPERSEKHNPLVLPGESKQTNSVSPQK